MRGSEGRAVVPSEGSLSPPGQHHTEESSESPPRHAVTAVTLARLPTAPQLRVPLHIAFAPMARHGQGRKGRLKRHPSSHTERLCEPGSRVPLASVSPSLKQVLWT